LDPQRDMVMSGKVGYLLLPQEFICGPKIEQEVWSPDGQHLAVLREVMDLTPTERSEMMLGLGDPAALDPEYEILVWSAVTQKTTIISRFKKSVGSVADVNWIAGSSSLIIRQEIPEEANGTAAHAVIFLLSKSGQRANVRMEEPQEYDEVLPAPNRPIVAMIEHHPLEVADPGTLPPGATAVQAVGGGEAKPQRVPPKVHFFGTDGVLSQAITLPRNGCIPFWSTNGHFYVRYLDRVAKGQPLKTTWYLVDQAAGKVTESAVPPDMAAAAVNSVAPELVSEDLAPRLAYKKLGVLAPTVIISKPKANDDEVAVVSTDGASGQLSPSYNAVSYRSQGSEMIRPLVKVSLEAYKQARVAALRSKIIDRAKQVGLALLMYANDYDDNYVSNAGNWQSQVEPYLKNMNLMDGFNLVFPGGSATAIENPADTVLGYIEGPGGRAVAYADGHVRWIPNP
jgi:prepilin-type processing-associated H-X9-DG protein